MDPSVSASFIPKKPLAEQRGGRSGGAGLLFLLSLLIFIASVVSAGGAFVYAKILNTSLDSKKASLAKYEQAYDLSTIQTLVRSDRRINEARKVLTTHLAPSALFRLLAENTLVKVRLNSFNYTLSPNSREAVIQINGVADSFATVALQSDKFGSAPQLHGVVFSNIAVDSDGKVAFSVTAKVDPSFILYSNNLTSDQTSAPTEVTPDTTTQ